MGGFRPAWVASTWRGPCVVVGHGWPSVLVASHGSGQIAVGRGSWVRSPWVAGRGSDRPLLHLAATLSGFRLHKRNPEFTSLSSTCVATSSSPSTMGLIGFLGFIFLDFWVLFF